MLVHRDESRAFLRRDDQYIWALDGVCVSSGNGKDILWGFTRSRMRMCQHSPLIPSIRHGMAYAYC